MSEREWSVRGGQFLTEQLVNGKWSATQVNCGYETRAGALADVARSGDGYRVVDRATSEPIVMEVAA